MKQRPTRAFTIVELLIVIVVIAILAAITIVAYNGIQNRAYDTTVQADLSSTLKKLQLFYVDNSRYPTAIAELNSLGLKVSKGAYNTTRKLNYSYCGTGSGSGYAIGGISKSGKQFYIASTTNSVKEYSSSLVNDGNREDLGGSCDDLVTSLNRIAGGWYSEDTVTGPWRAWTGS